jgi:hypothetical protein
MVVPTKRRVSSRYRSLAKIGKGELGVHGLTSVNFGDNIDAHWDIQYSQAHSTSRKASTGWVIKSGSSEWTGTYTRLLEK